MKKNPGPDDLIVIIYWTFKEEIITVLHKLFQRTEEEGALSNSLYETRITPVPKS